MRFVAGLVLSAALLLPASLAADAPSYGARLDTAIAAAAGEVGGDPAKALAFVAGATAYEPYQGALRGARGAYATGRGNSVDRALLLQAVLKPAASRFAQCTLSGADAVRLAEAAAPAGTSLAIEQARKSWDEGGVPIGAVLVLRGAHRGRLPGSSSDRGSAAGELPGVLGALGVGAVVVLRSGLGEGGLDGVLAVVHGPAGRGGRGRGRSRGDDDDRHRGARRPGGRGRWGRRSPAIRRQR